MSGYIKQSEELSNDLSFLIERANKLANELESNIKIISKLKKTSATKKSTTTAKKVKKPTKKKI